MKAHVVIVTLFVALIAPAEGEAQVQLNIGDMFRSMSGALRGKERQPEKQENTAPVMGIRGIDEPGQATAVATSTDGDYLLMEGWVATQAEANAMAQGKNLIARPVTLKQGKPQPSNPSDPQ